MHPRLRALADLLVPDMRELAGRHEYDGQVPDLSSAAVSAALARLGGEPMPEPHTEAHVATHEAAARVQYGQLRVHRTNPLVHLTALDVSCYDRTYAPAPERERARTTHLKQWPDAVDVAVTALDEVPAPVAAALVPAARGLAAAVRDDDADVGTAATAAVDRLVGHLEVAAREGRADAAIGRRALEALMTQTDALPFDAAVVGARAERERERLWAVLTEAVARLAPGEPVAAIVASLLADHPQADSVLDEARALSAETVAFTAAHDLAPVDGELVVEQSPPSRRWAVAMMAWSAPYEPDAPSLYSITPPDPAWTAAEQAQWLSMFSRTTLPAITVHEVAPGHFSHGRALRRCEGDVPRLLQGAAFAEGWAHYVEELFVELGFRADDPRFAVGVALEALCRVVRLECAIGIHTGAFDVDDATRRFEAHALMGHSGARAEARRATFDPAYGCYTWGKWAILDQRDRAQREWGPQFSLPRFHRALLALGSPPLGLLDAAVSA